MGMFKYQWLGDAVHRCVGCGNRLIPVACATKVFGRQGHFTLCAAAVITYLQVLLTPLLEAFESLALPLPFRKMTSRWTYR